MSWWDSAGIGNLASAALKTAQSKIDKALDIKEDEAQKRRKAVQKKLDDEKAAKLSAEKPEDDGEASSKDESGSSWAGWMSGGSTDAGEGGTTSGAKSSSDSYSNWGLPWGGSAASSGSSESGWPAQPSAKKATPSKRKTLSRRSSVELKKCVDSDSASGKSEANASSGGEIAGSIDDKISEILSSDGSTSKKELADRLKNNPPSSTEISAEVTSTSSHSETDSNIERDKVVSDDFESNSSSVCNNVKTQDTSAPIDNSASSSFTNVYPENIAPSLLVGSTENTSVELPHEESEQSNSARDVSAAECDTNTTTVSQDFVNITSVNSDAGRQSYGDSSGVSATPVCEPDLEVTSRTSSCDPEGEAVESASSVDTVVAPGSMSDSSGDVPGEAQAAFSIFEENKDVSGSDMMDQSGVSEDPDGNSVSSSYVKCMLEEAMEERRADSGSDNLSNGSKSESSKVDSEFEKTSGHESSDDIETTTSSDIEIIAAPSAGDDSGKFHTAFDLSPLKLARSQGSRWSDSQSSSSGGKDAEAADVDSHLQSVREEDTGGDPYHPERLLKLCATAMHQNSTLAGKKLADMAEVLQARENKLIQLSKDNHMLTEDNNILRNQLQQSEEAREVETADLNTLTNEFTARLAEQEKKMQAIMKEKDNLKQKLSKTEAEMSRRSANTDIEALLEEKTEQCAELLAEGEKLSKQQLQSNTIIKKLRVKEKEMEASSKADKKKIEEQTKELERLHVVLDSKEEMEKTQANAIDQLNAAVAKQEKELTQRRSASEDFDEKLRSLQQALDNSYKEIAELHRSNASQDSKAQEAALSAESHVREVLKAEMEAQANKWRQEREAYVMQADDLRIDMTRLEKEHSRREEMLRDEIGHLQERLQQDESRSQELTQTVSTATRPLLRQIENLQATHSMQAQAWEKVERSLTDRLAEGQTSLAMAQEKERCAVERQMELSARLSAVESVSQRVKGEKAALAAELEVCRGRLEEVEDTRTSVVAQLESSKQKMSEELQQLKVDKVHLESQMNVEKNKFDSEVKKSLALEEQLRVAMQDRPHSRGTPSPSPSMSVSRQDSLLGSYHTDTTSTPHRQPSPGWGWSFTESASPQPGSINQASMYESMRGSGNAIVMENLQSQLKLREGESSQLRLEIQNLERTRESMARELVNLSNQNDQLMEEKEVAERLKVEHQELSVRYNSLLQMYGEKEEQVQELRLDLQDVKEMYKTQIDALLAK